MKIVLLGGERSGKTTLKYLYIDHYVSEGYDPTLDDVATAKRVIGGEIWQLDIHDTSGLDELSIIRQQAIESGHGYIIVYDICSRGSFGKVTQFYHEICEWSVKEVPDNADLSTICIRPPILILGNKNDLVGERKVFTREGKDLARKLGCEFRETSARSFKCDMDPFLLVACRIKQHSYAGKKRAVRVEKASQCHLSDKRPYYGHGSPQSTFICVQDPNVTQTAPNTKRVQRFDCDDKSATSTWKETFESGAKFILRTLQSCVKIGNQKRSNVSGIVESEDMFR
ncbi:P-loop containing nucleoside triphosphate hydrolase protein [Delphinella strobiligena]|nr:P-loop containing nucleoside triphosphate hydrolase protein [Delphinella strobiligena]